MIRQVTITPYLKYPGGYSTGFIGKDEKKPDLTIVRLAFKATANFEIKDCSWKMVTRNAVIGSSKTINIPFDIEDTSNFDPPLTDFKMKLWLKKEGEIDLVFTVDGHSKKMTLTRTMLLKFSDDPSVLAEQLIYETEPTPEPIPEPTPEPEPEGFVPQLGDIVAEKAKLGLRLLNWVTQLLPSIRENLPLKSIWSHVMYFLNSTTLFSAESSGLKDVLWEDRKKKAKKLEVYRFTDHIDQEAISNIPNIVETELRGKGYAYSRWILSFLVTACFFIVLYGIFVSPFNWKITAGLVALVAILLLVVKPMLKKKDKLTYDCAETVSYTFERIGLFVPKYLARDDTPNSIYQVLKNLENHGIVRKVWEKQ